MHRDGGARPDERLGHHPLVDDVRGTVDVAEKVLVAGARWVKPSTRDSHSYDATTRGRASMGNARWPPVTPKVMPRLSAFSRMSASRRMFFGAHGIERP